MANISLLLASILLIIIMCANISQSEANNDNLSEKTIEVFKWGKYTTHRVNKNTLKVFKSPKELVIISPEESGNYPILFFVHGTGLSNDGYIQLFEFIASHGVIVVAPLFYRLPFMPSHQDEINDAATMVNWISTNINSVKPGKPSKRILPDNVIANLKALTVSGHSRGGKTAFALVLGKAKLKDTVFDPAVISALIALDPVAGSSAKDRTTPYILTNLANSLDISIPTTIIGMGYGDRCAPKGVNHDEFYRECKQGSHFVITDYGHCDMLDDKPWTSWFNSIMRNMCGTKQDGSYEAVRRTVGGLMVAFLDAHFGGNPIQFHEILSHPSVAPTKLYPVDNKVQTLLRSVA